LWGDAITLELTHTFDYDKVIDKGYYTKVNAPSGYKTVLVHFVFDFKHDYRRKARLVADGHLTQVPVNLVYSGV
jgi:hypothetical protein